MRNVLSRLKNINAQQTDSMINDGKITVTKVNTMVLMPDKH